MKTMKKLFMLMAILFFSCTPNNKELNISIDSVQITETINYLDSTNNIIEEKTDIIIDSISNVKQFKRNKELDSSIIQVNEDKNAMDKILKNKKEN